MTRLTGRWVACATLASVVWNRRCEGPMPEVSRFYGIVIKIHYADHNSPHFHATYQGRRVEIDIRNLAVIDGSIPARALGLVAEWAALHQDELAQAWVLASEGKPPRKIAPLA